MPLPAPKYTRSHFSGTSVRAAPPSSPATAICPNVCGLARSRLRNTSRGSSSPRAATSASRASCAALVPAPPAATTTATTAAATHAATSATKSCILRLGDIAHILARADEHERRQAHRDDERGAEDGDRGLRARQRPQRAERDRGQELRHAARRV